jgi:hypothetical protein
VGKEVESQSGLLRFGQAIPYSPVWPGIDQVLLWVAEIYKGSRRAAFTDWVYYCHASPLEPGFRQAIVAHLQAKHRDLLPPDLLACQSFELVDQIPFLIDSIRTVQSTA